MSRHPKLLEGKFRGLGEHNVLPRTKHTVAQHHLQLHGKTPSNLKESGFLVVVVGRGRSRGFGSHGQEVFAEEDHLGKEITDEEVSKLREFSAAGE